MKLIFDDKDKFVSIDIEDLKLAEYHQKFPLTIVDSIHARFIDSVEIIKQKVKSVLELSQEDISLYLFDSVIGGKKAYWVQTSWVEKDFEEALTFVEVSLYH
jgi:hypothetical protein